MGMTRRIGKRACVAAALAVCGWQGLACGQGPDVEPVVEVQAALGASGCSTNLQPAIGDEGPPALGAAGPWQFCGAYGTGGAHIVKTSADGRRIALLTDSGQAWVLEADSFRAHGPFAHGNGAISFVGLSPDGQLLATVDDAGARVALWNVNRGELLRVMRRPPLEGPSYYGLGDVAFSHDGHLLAVVSGSHTDVFRTATGAPLPISARTDVGGAMRVEFAAHDRRLVLGRFTYFGNGPFAGFGRVDLVDARTGDAPATLGTSLGSELPAIAVSGDGDTIAVGAAEVGFAPITFFDATTGAVIREQPAPGVPLALDAHGERLAQIEPPPGGSSLPPGSPHTITVRRISDGTVLRSVTVAGSTAFPREKLFAVTPDLRGLLVGDVAPNVLTSLRISDGGTRAVACGSGHNTDVVALAVTPDGQTLVSTGDSSDGRRLAWDVDSGAPVAVVPPPAGLRGPSATSPDGTLVAGPTDPPSANFVLRDTGSGAIVRTLGPQVSHPATFDFAPGGRLIASSSTRDPADRRTPPVVGAWTVDTGVLQQALLVVTSQPEPSAQAVLFDSRRRLFVAGYATTALWCR